MARVFCLVLLLGCGATSSPGSNGSSVSDDDTNRDEVERDYTDGAEETNGEGEGDVSASKCSERRGTDCRTQDGCVPLPNGACREATHECELIELDHRGLTPVFDRGDPCERVNPDCAWSGATQRCAPFVPVPSCPATADDAAELSVFCDHSEQPALGCSYPGTECTCQRTPYCGGAAPPPEQAFPPAHFSCVPDFDDRGCPNRPVRQGTRCDVDPSIQCHVGCYSLYTCENGRWRHRQLPPRP